MSVTARNCLARTMLAAIALSVASWQGAQAEQGLSSQTLKELAQVRRATARYHNILNAYADGYVEADFDPPGIGCHMINIGYLFDPEIDLEKPELLIYDDCSGTARGKSELRAVEYALACALDCASTPMPEGFSGDHDVWEVFVGTPYLWTLHAWVWRHNPDGIFVKVNPAID